MNHLHDQNIKHLYEVSKNQTKVAIRQLYALAQTVALTWKKFDAMPWACEKDKLDAFDHLNYLLEHANQVIENFKRYDWVNDETQPTL